MMMFFLTSGVSGVERVRRVYQVVGACAPYRGPEAHPLLTSWGPRSWDGYEAWSSRAVKTESAGCPSYRGRQDEALALRSSAARPWTMFRSACAESHRWHGKHGEAGGHAMRRGEGQCQRCGKGYDRDPRGTWPMALGTNYWRSQLGEGEARASFRRLLVPT